SKTTAPAARPTALIARPVNKKTTAAPIINPTRLLGSATFKMPWKAYASRMDSPLASSTSILAASTASLIESVNDPNNAVAASTAVAMAMPLVMALVVLPTASSSLRIWAPSSSTSPDISAMPCALSLTGPNVSMATITPTVVKSQHPARATANNETVTEPQPIKNAPKTAAPITNALYTADSKPTDRPDKITVAGPVNDVLPTSWTGRVSVPVK